MTKEDLKEILDFAKAYDLMHKPFIEVVETWFQDKIDNYETPQVEFILNTNWED